jgi:hypothetical protein
VSYIGPDYCMLDSTNRVVWFYNIFMDQDVWTSEVAISLNFTNPETNFFDFLTEDEKSFHITTYAFDLKTFSYLPTASIPFNADDI